MAGFNPIRAIRESAFLATFTTVSTSTIQDKDIILRVLSMYEDPAEREQQIRNMSVVYDEIAKGILPELRRARLIANYDVIGRSDAQIQEQAEVKIED